MKRIDKVHHYCTAYTESLSKKILLNDTDIGITAKEVSLELDILRNNASSDLNKLMRQDKLLKLSGKPTRFLCKKILCQRLNLRYIGETEINSIQELMKDNYSSKKIHPFDSLIGANKSLQPVIQLAEAAINYPLRGLHMMIFGESGTGKSLLAEKIFDYGKQENIFNEKANFSVLNCADYASNPQLLLSHLFGNVKGAYTGADADRVGLIEAANGGILFLDEVHRLPPEGQEMLFQFIDKNQFYKLGDSVNKRYASTLLITATTEPPNSALLETFKRRIPVMIQLPNFQERSIAERLDLISFLYNKETEKIGSQIIVQPDAIQALLAYTPLGNIGQLKSDIQLSVARALLEKKKNNSKEVLITQDFFPPTVLSSLIKINLADKKEIETIVGVKPFIFDTTLDEDRKTIASYDFVNFFTKNYSNSPRSITQAFNDYSQEIAKERLRNDHFTFLLNDDIKSIVLLISDILYNTLGIILDKNVSTAFALYIHSHTQQNDIFFSQIKTTEKLPANVMQVTRKIVKQLEQKKKIIFSQNEIHSLSLIVSSIVENKTNSKNVSILVCAHGERVASEIAHTVNSLLSKEIIVPVDMPLHSTPKQTYDAIKKTIADFESTEIFIFADMGSLVNFESNLRKETQKSIFIIERIDTLIILEAAKNTEFLSMGLQSTINNILDIDNRRNTLLNNKIVSKFNKRKSKIIYTVCQTGEGTARFLEENIKSLLKELKIFDVDVQSISGHNGTSIRETMLRSKDIEIIAIVGTVNPKISYAPFVSLEEIVLHDGLDKVLCHLTTEEQQSKKGSNHSFTRNIVFDMGIEAVDKYLYLLAGNKIQKSLMDFIEELECTFHKKFTYSILLKLLIHTACLIERTLINGHELKIISEDDTRPSHEPIFHVKKAFKNIETEFGITVSYDECFFIYDIIASK